VKDVELDLWAKFTAEGRQRMKASAYMYREWCETDGRDSSQPVKFNTKNGPVLRVAEYYRVAKSVEWANLGPATETNIKSHPQVW